MHACMRPLRNWLYLSALPSLATLVRRSFHSLERMCHAVAAHAAAAAAIILVVLGVGAYHIPVICDCGTLCIFALRPALALAHTIVIPIALACVGVPLQ